MRIIVLVKEVPDTYGSRTLDLQTGLADRDASERVLDEIGERAIEFAVSSAEQHPGTEVVLLSAGPDSVPATLRKGLAMGASRAVHVRDDGMRGADLTLTAEALARAIERIGFDLVVAGNLSTDGSGGVVPAMVAQWLGVPHATNLDAAGIEDGTVSGERASDGGVLRLSAPLPAVLSITERLPDPRFPHFTGIMAAKRKPFETLGLADLGVDAGADTPRSVVLAVNERPARAAGVKIVDDGDAGTRIAEFLVQNRLA
ncbi:electron transfer flavoprotein subunit beta/FixA family protein [Microbacterium betulae]|uniref:Electron transfer flavoprotein subunit beta n=1 Tax=Microbacterium betulae TaxID=2981139 RepID=A0AA97FGP3_9MICO|nr:electron transfer flavoprotein subunit beta/FixA family protein [Microbacterium sp. AB]WOF22853.1 electron transfer flavoprotein subunit beta/FixA family protein [Microbacterium sp. AB]